jgi:hypothetical protein
MFVSIHSFGNFSDILTNFVAAAWTIVSGLNLLIISSIEKKLETSLGALSTFNRLEAC